MTARVFVLDNYDSFTYNLVDYIATAGAEVRVERNDAVSADAVDDWAPTHLVVSPGPGTPADAGVSADLIARAASRIPVLGVCLGHQVIVELYGGAVGRAGQIVHGKPDQVSHDGSPLYAGIPSPFEAGRYHSLAAVGAVPAVLEVTARTPDGEVMGVRHREHAVHGVQFHPESVLTPHGRTLIGNFLAMTERQA
ncbi:MAG TPA: aminodeoxychorismate/anthranilate synthase component II [Gaiellales bacterium]|jgi:anthranilate synthase/aminodeoxychorismate synthase-like glutamine amidotransferase